jgi:DNA-binding MarR family transcriptional regulator
MVSILYRYNQRFFALKLEEFSLPIEVGQIPALMQIYRLPGIIQDEISSNAGIDKGTAARTLTQLESNGLVVRVTDERDRRVNHIFATEEGMKIKEKVFRVIEELHEILYHEFSEIEIDEAISMLERMKNNIGNYLNSIK